MACSQESTTVIRNVLHEILAPFLSKLEDNMQEAFAISRSIAIEMKGLTSKVVRSVTDISFKHSNLHQSLVPASHTYETNASYLSAQQEERDLR